MVIEDIAAPSKKSSPDWNFLLGDLPLVVPLQQARKEWIVLCKKRQSLKCQEISEEKWSSDWLHNHIQRRPRAYLCNSDSTISTVFRGKCREEGGGHKSTWKWSLSTLKINIAFLSEPSPSCLVSQSVIESILLLDLLIFLNSRNLSKSHATSSCPEGPARWER